MVEEITYTINEFEQEVIVLSTITIIRLFELSSNATNLYLFYIKNSKIQKTNTVWSTDGFCMKGLGWGKDKFRTAKNILLENKFIEPVIRRDDKGIVVKHYIRIHYLKNNSPLTPKPTEWTNPPSGKQETNAVNKKENAVNKNIKILFDFWNEQKLTVHGNLTEHISETINRALKLYRLSELKGAITNYSYIIHNPDKFFFSYRWNLAQFLRRGLSKQGIVDKKGFQMFLSVNKPQGQFAKQQFTKPISDIEQLRLEFKPITTEWTTTKILDTDCNTYYGFDTNALKHHQVFKEDKFTTREMIIRDKRITEYGYFFLLERCVAYMLFNRKSGISENDLKEFMHYWRRNKKAWKQVALDIRSSHV